MKQRNELSLKEMNRLTLEFMNTWFAVEVKEWVGWNWGKLLKMAWKKQLSETDEFKSE